MFNTIRNIVILGAIAASVASAQTPANHNIYVRPDVVAQIDTLSYMSYRVGPLVDQTKQAQQVTIDIQDGPFDAAFAAKIGLKEHLSLPHLKPNGDADVDAQGDMKLYTIYSNSGDLLAAWFRNLAGK